ncbi:hypothetical protein BCR33DRAFT_58784 [Rhizoclosmatium globosum]|uniref:Uncharacterized protein n=1 Tax=Rhizoclosmatium globosum TaxID=329046 RepID=A0A1Y2CMQ5_9FUNG|nr:hypothetical protein BCR33DRAFT_58784 [Rhizoclosmatium globosum]|eukprot:ORY48114.1 hypothetical protein BCR33DRAFT_58784 [Rhizoclosmatium globosum]
MSYIGLGLNLTVPRRGVFTGPNGQRFNPAAPPSRTSAEQQAHSQTLQELRAMRRDSVSRVSDSAALTSPTASDVPATASTTNIAEDCGNVWEADEVAPDFYDADDDHNESLPPPISTTPVTFAATAFGISQGLYVLASMIPQLSKYTLARTRLNSMFQEMESRLLAFLSLFVTPNLIDESCSASGCESAAEARCFSCRPLSLPSVFCMTHAKTHAHQFLCHQVLTDRNLRICTPAGEKWVRCCEDARASLSTFQTTLHSYIAGHCSEKVTVLRCANHLNDAPSTLMELGFMACGVDSPQHAFSVMMVDLASRLRAKGVAYQTCAEVFFGNEFEDSRQANLYKPFMDAVRHYSGLSHRIRHGLLTEATMRRFSGDSSLSWKYGRTTCPACVGCSDSKSPVSVVCI